MAISYGIPSRSPWCASFDDCSHIVRGTPMLHMRNHCNPIRVPHFTMAVLSGHETDVHEPAVSQCLKSFLRIPADVGRLGGFSMMMFTRFLRGNVVFRGRFPETIPVIKGLTRLGALSHDGLACWPWLHRTPMPARFSNCRSLVGDCCVKGRQQAFTKC